MTTRNKQTRFPALYIIDDLIKRGLVKRARKELRALDIETIPREVLAELAGLGRRASMPEWSLSALHPFVRRTAVSIKPATDLEIAEYAANLTRIGALQEAWDLLAKIDPKKVPIVALYRAFVCVLRWDYAGSIPLLESYLDNTTLSSYDRLIGMINLAAAYVDEEKPESAKPLLAALVIRTEHDKHFLLLAHSLKLQAQLAIREKRWHQAQQILTRTHQIFSHSGGLDVFLVRKLEAILAVSKDPKDKAAWKKFTKIEKEARSREHWESVRDCDLWRAKLLGRKDLAAKLYFGTPFGPYKARLERFIGTKIPESYSWELREAKRPKILDLASIEVDLEQRRALGELPWTLLRALCSDIYRPLSTPFLHSILYPGEFYNPLSSRTRLKMVLVKLRRWLEIEKIPLRVIYGKSGYALTAKGALTIRYQRRAEALSKSAASITILQNHFAGKPFSVSEAVEVLSLPKRTVQRALDEAVKSGSLERVGKSAATRYLPKAA